MSDVTDFENAAPQILAGLATVADASESVLTVISAYGAVVVALTALVLILTKTDEIGDAVKQLEAHFDAVLSAENQVLQMRDVAKQLNAARAQLDPIRQLSPGQSLTDAQRATMDSTTDEVVRTLGDSSFWKRPFFPELVYPGVPSGASTDDHWSGYLTPDPSLAPGSLVFDYRLTLAAYLEAIVIRLIVMLALEGKFTPAHQREIAEIASQLEGYYNTIRAAIVEIRKPTSIEIGYFGIPARSSWDTDGEPETPSAPFGRRYGAVEKYSAYHIVDHWPVQRFPTEVDQGMEGRWTDAIVRNFYATLGLGALARWKKVYAAVSLPAVKSCLIQLKALAGQPSPQRLDPGSGWSLREVDNLLATTILNQPTTGSPTSPISAIHLLRMINLNVPTKLGVAFGIFW
jgi:hypothetical protein